MDFRQYALKYKDEAIEMLKELVSINSIMDMSTAGINQPFGKGINDCLLKMQEKGLKDGFDVLNDEGYALKIESKGQGSDAIAVLGHLDVVPVDDNWTNPPFEPTIIDNKLYGRGSTDDKGPVVAAYIALKILKNEGFKLNKNVELILGTDEETEWRGIAHYQKKYKIPEIGFSPDAEWPLINGEKGILRIELNGLGSDEFTLSGGKVYNAVIGDAMATTDVDLTLEFNLYLEAHKLKGDVSYVNGQYEYHIIGKTAHAMSPEIGINAGCHLARFLNNYFDHPTLKFIANCCFEDYNMAKLGMKVEHPVMGIITCNIGIMDFNKDSSKFTFDIRYPEGFKFEDFQPAFTNILNVYQIKYEVKEYKPTHYVEPSSPLVQTLYRSYVKYTNDKVNKPKCIGGGTYAKVLKQGVAFGLEDPSIPSVCHISDEYIDLDRFIEAIAIYADAIYELGK